MTDDEKVRAISDRLSNDMAALLLMLFEKLKENPEQRERIRKAVAEDGERFYMGVEIQQCAMDIRVTLVKSTGNDLPALLHLKVPHKPDVLH